MIGIGILMTLGAVVIYGSMLIEKHPIDE